MKRLAAALLTAALMALMVRAGLRRPPPTPEPAAPETRSETPRSAPATPPQADPLEPAAAQVRRLLDCARFGDIDEYLNNFNGTLRARLERDIAEQGRAAFAAALRRAAESRKGHAVFAPVPDGPDSARVTVETVYPDRNERQTFRLDRTPAGWRVVAVDPVRAHEPPVKYGAPATFESPEGVPVPTDRLPAPTDTTAP